MKYCVNCEKNVIPKRHFGVLDFIFCCFSVGFYLLIYFAKPKRCPSCNGTHFTSEKKGAELRSNNR